MMATDPIEELRQRVESLEQKHGHLNNGTQELEIYLRTRVSDLQMDILAITELARRLNLFSYPDLERVAKELEGILLIEKATNPEFGAASAKEMEEIRAWLRQQREKDAQGGAS